MNGRLGFRLNAPPRASFWAHYSGHAYHIELSEDDRAYGVMAEEEAPCFIIGKKDPNSSPRFLIDSTQINPYLATTHQILPKIQPYQTIDLMSCY